MSTQAMPYLTPEQYLEIERKAEYRSEYINGQVFAMSGGTLNHARIVGNTLSRLLEQLRGKPCEPAANDLRLFCAKDRIFTYPDILVACGPHQFVDGRRDTISDATAVVEVLSPSTMNYDRGEKFRYYRSLASFRDYLLLGQEAVRAEHYVRQPDGAWLFREFESPETEIELSSIGCRLKLESLYERVEFEAES
jgi:Uma2 family endonuclease